MARNYTKLGSDVAKFINAHLVATGRLSGKGEPKSEGAFIAEDGARYFVTRYDAVAEERVAAVQPKVRVKAQKPAPIATLPPAAPAPAPQAPALNLDPAFAQALTQALMQALGGALKK